MNHFKLNFDLINFTKSIHLANTHPNSHSITYISCDYIHIKIVYWYRMYLILKCSWHFRCWMIHMVHLLWLGLQLHGLSLAISLFVSMLTLPIWRSVNLVQKFQSVCVCVCGLTCTHTFFIGSLYFPHFLATCWNLIFEANEIRYAISIPIKFI